MRRTLRAATRGSRLALRQVELVAERLGVPIEPVTVSTVGDRLPDLPLRAIAGKGAFTGEVRGALAADIVVHSAKDLPPAHDNRFATTYLARGDARDVLVGCTLGELPHGATIATGATRRRAQLAALRPDLRFVEPRGNIDTRLAKAHTFDAIVVAAAALHPLRIAPAGPTHVLPVDLFVPQVGQGVIAVEARSGDATTCARVAEHDDDATRRETTAERSFLAVPGGDCDLPAGADATVDDHGVVSIRAVLAADDGRLVRHRGSATEPGSAGTVAATDLRDQLDEISGHPHRSRTVA